ncbi:MAG: hypothetical protein QOI20_439 [Acidimicrobiaceae bacterium]|nr:hypothetical protein [Acidimicrobiaceae bacterium]
MLTLAVGDPAAVWDDLGFEVDGGCCVVGGVCFALGAQGRGVRAWSLAAIDGLRTCDPVSSRPAAADGPAAGRHANGVVGLDHLVLTTPDHQRTLDAFAAEGWDLRRVRETDTYGTPMRQGFFKIDSVVLEVVGPAEPTGEGPARFWGLAFTSDDLDATAAWLGPRVHPAKDAVQPGRRIATLDRDAGSTVPIAFMSR